MKKIYLLLAAFASLSVFSAVSTSKAYYARFAEIIPSSACEALFPAEADQLFFDPRGIINAGPAPINAPEIFVTCPLSRSSALKGREVYSVAANLQNLGITDRQIFCSLWEVSNTGEVIQLLTRTTTLPAEGKARLVFERVVIRAKGNRSGLSLQCGLPVSSQLGTIELGAQRPL